MDALRLAGRVAALALMGLGLLVGWLGLAQMAIEPAHLVFFRNVIPGALMIVAGVALEAVVWRPRRRIRK
jgi:hypothetical protein